MKLDKIRCLALVVFNDCSGCRVIYFFVFFPFVCVCVCERVYWLFNNFFFRLLVVRSVESDAVWRAAAFDEKILIIKYSGSAS